MTERRRSPRWWWRLALALSAAMFAPACAPAASAPPRHAPLEAAATVAVLDRLYFGREIPGGGTVSDAEWAAFLAEVVTPRFPEGLTAWPAHGQWRDRSGDVVREPSFVVELIHPPSREADDALAEIVEEYRRRFRQEAVLHVRDHVHVRF